jgi:hypothetical protein
MSLIACGPGLSVNSRDPTATTRLIGQFWGPEAPRRMSYFDAFTGKRLVYLTNNFTLPALTIAISPSRFDSQAMIVMFVTSVGSIPQKSHNHVVNCDHNQETPYRH